MSPDTHDRSDEAELPPQTPGIIYPVQMDGVVAMLPDGYPNRNIMVAGCGTTGSWTAYMLAMLGFKSIVVVDPDLVEPHNVSPQFLGNFARAFTPMYKVDSFRDAMAALNLPYPHTESRSIEEDFEKVPLDTEYLSNGLTVFSCVDSIESRRSISNTLAKAVADYTDVETGAVPDVELIDYRMGRIHGSIYYVGSNGPMSFAEFNKTLEGTFVEEPCGARAFLPTAFSIVGLGIGHWIHGRRGLCTLKSRLDVYAGVGRTFDVRPNSVEVVCTDNGGSSTS